MNKHTPGPWSAHYNNEGLTVFSPDNVTVAYVDYDECEERPVEANAHLIAAAPAMYEALVETMKVLRSLRDNKEEWYTLVTPELLTAWDKNKAALAQAEGR